MFSLANSPRTLWVVIPFVASLGGLMVNHHPAAVTSLSIHIFDPSAPNGEDDALPSLSIDSVTVDESDATATFTITRKGNASEDVSVRAATSGVGATENRDYRGQATDITITKGGTVKTQTFTVAIIDDAIDESTETFSVRLTEPIGAVILGSPGIGTITDDDTAGVTVDQQDGIFVLEGEEADTLSIVLNSEPTADVIITTSVATDQLSATPKVATFGPTNWQTPRPIAVAAVPDGMDEPDPHLFPVSFSVRSADLNYDGLPMADLTATIGDADSLLATIDGPGVGAPGQAATFAATINAGGIGAITYDWTAFFEGNEVASGGRDTFQFTPSEAGRYNIQVIIGDDKGRNPATFIQFKALGDIGGSVFVGDIVWLAEDGITRGCNPPANDLYCPNDIVTREQMAAFLVRSLGLTDNGGGNTFVDNKGSIFEDDIAKLAQAGITQGCNPPTNDRFCPNGIVTREHMAAFLVRALKLTDDGGGNTFTDDDGSIFETDIAKLAAAGITRGCNPPENTQFCPTAFVTRGQMAAFLRRADAILSP